MKKIFFLVFAFLLLNSTFIFGADSSCKPVMLADQKVLCLKNGMGVMKAEERALLIEKRLKHVADDFSLDPDKIALVPQEEGFNVNLGDYYIVSLRDGDFDYAQGESFEIVAKSVVHNIKSAIISYRDATGPETMFRGAVYTAVATLALFIVLFFFSKIFPKIYLMIEEKGKGIPSLKIQNWEVLNSARVVQFIIWIAHVARTLLTLLALYIYIPLVMSFFPQTAPMAPYVFSFIADPLRSIFNAFVAFIPNFFVIVVIVVIATYALKLIRFFFDEIERGNIEFEGFYKDWAMPSYMLVRGLVIAFSLVVIFPYIPGSDSSAFKGVSVFFGVLLSLGSSSSIANIVAGVVITYMRPFRIGDVVKINDTIGRVSEKNLLVTRIKTNKNIDITVPNSMILGSHIANFSKNAQTDGLILNLNVSIGYDLDWQKVHKILTEAALRTPQVLTDPAPFVWNKKLDDFYASYELNVYVRNAPAMGQITSDLNKNIQDCFHENGLELVLPSFTAVRDGNETTLPLEFRKSDSMGPKFNLK